MSKVPLFSLDIIKMNKQRRKHLMKMVISVREMSAHGTKMAHFPS